MRKILKKFITKIEFDETRYIKPSMGLLINNWLYDWSNKEIDEEIDEEPKYLIIPQIVQLQKAIILFWLVLGIECFLQWKYYLGLDRYLIMARVFFGMSVYSFFVLRKNWDWETINKKYFENEKSNKTMFLEGSDA